MLIARAANADLTWHKDISSAPRVSPEFDLTLDDKAVLRAVEQLNFIQMKRKCPAKRPVSICIHWFASTFPQRVRCWRTTKNITWQLHYRRIVLVSLFAAYCACSSLAWPHSLSIYGRQVSFRSHLNPF
jgi:hypothetical protein